MKIPKNIYIYSIIATVIVGAVIFWISRADNKIDDVVDMSTLFGASPSPDQSPLPSQTPRLSNNTPKPTPGIIVSEVASYQSWVKWLDPQNRRLALDEDCTSIVPSQVDYPNNVEVMLDNSASNKPRILKIGSQNYSLNAQGWIVTTLHSETLPAKLTMFCGDMELGQLDLVAK